jgi:hypothetical protein
MLRGVKGGVETLYLDKGREAGDIRTVLSGTATP